MGQPRVATAHSTPKGRPSQHTNDTKGCQVVMSLELLLALKWSHTSHSLVKYGNRRLRSPVQLLSNQKRNVIDNLIESTAMRTPARASRAALLVMLMVVVVVAHHVSC